VKVRLFELKKNMNVIEFEMKVFKILCMI